MLCKFGDGCWNISEFLSILPSQYFHSWGWNILPGRSSKMALKSFPSEVDPWPSSTGLTVAHMWHISHMYAQYLIASWPLVTYSNIRWVLGVINTGVALCIYLGCQRQGLDSWGKWNCEELGSFWQYITRHAIINSLAARKSGINFIHFFLICKDMSWI